MKKAHAPLPYPPIQAHCPTEIGERPTSPNATAEEITFDQEVCRPLAKAATPGSFLVTTTSTHLLPVS